MEQVGRVRFDWREGLALVCALGCNAVESDPQAVSLSIRGLAYLAACRRAGGAAALDKLPPRAQERLLSAERKATRGALARLGDLGLVVWDLPEERTELGFRLTEPGWRTALHFGRRVAKQRAAVAEKSVSLAAGA